ncbi:MAG: hypothetical protein RLZ70_1497 [Verrucomicrobiota bacterium]|jgi:hypothetical protein
MNFPNPQEDATESVVYRFKFPETFELTFPASKTKWILVGLICLVLCFGGVLGVQSGEFIGWFVAAFFGLGLIGSLIQLLPGAAYLKIGPAGIESRTLFRTRRIAWSEISGFGSYRQSGNNFVGFNFHATAKGFSQNASLALVGFHDALPDTYGHKADELAVLLTACRSHFLKVPPSVSSPAAPQ